MISFHNRASYRLTDLTLRPGHGALESHDMSPRVHKYGITDAADSASFSNNMQREGQKRGKKREETHSTQAVRHEGII